MFQIANSSEIEFNQIKQIQILSYHNENKTTRRLYCVEWFEICHFTVHYKVGDCLCVIGGGLVNQLQF